MKLAHEDRPRHAVRLPAAGRREPARPLPVREPAPARPRRPDHDQQPRPPAGLGGRRHPHRQGLLVPTNGSVGTLTVSPRFLVAGRTRCWIASSSTCSTSTSRSCRSCRSSSCGESTSVNVATFHAYGGFSPAYEFGSAGCCGRRPGGSTAGSRSARRRATSSTASSPATTRSSPTASTSTASSAPCRSRAGRTARRTSCSSAGSRTRKGLLDLLKAYRILRKTGCDCRLLVVGGGPQEREARRYVLTRRLRASSSWAGSATTRRPQLFKTADVYVLAGDRPRVVRDRAARGDGRRDADRVQRHPRLQGRRPARREALLVPPRKPKAIAGALAKLLGDDGAASAMAQSGLERAQEFSWERVTAKVDDYYGFVIRRLAAAGPAAGGLPRRRPAVAAACRVILGLVRRRAAPSGASAGALSRAGHRRFATPHPGRRSAMRDRATTTRCSRRRSRP